MTKFVTFRHKSNGVISTYPEHYATHPVLGDDLEIFVEGDEYEVEKVIISAPDSGSRARNVAHSRKKATADAEPVSDTAVEDGNEIEEN